MRYDYIEPFVASTMRVLDSIMQSDVSKGDLSLIHSAYPDDGLAILIRINGDSEGFIIVNMDADTADRICAIMAGEECDSSGIMKTDVISELANMIAGNAVSALNDLGFRFDLEPPSVLTCMDDCSGIAPVEAFLVPLFTEYGEIDVNFSVRTN